MRKAFGSLCRRPPVPPAGQQALHRPPGSPSSRLPGPLRRELWGPWSMDACGGLFDYSNIEPAVAELLDPYAANVLGLDLDSFDIT